MTNDRRLFLAEPVNTGRQPELDVIKGLAIFFMVMIHSFERFSPQPLPQTASTYIIEFLCSPGAPIFMALLGLGIVYTSKSRPADLLGRGWKVFLIAYLLNFGRGTLLYFTMYLTKGDAAYLNKAANEFWSVDILQFAGLTFIFFALMFRFKARAEHFILVILLTGVINLLGAGIKTSTEFPGVLLGLFWGANDIAYFPFFTWIIYPLFGYLFGLMLIHCEDTGRFYRKAFVIALTAAILFTMYSFKYAIPFGAEDGLYQQTYYHHDFVGNMVLLSMALAYISLIHFASKLIPGLVMDTLKRWSHNIINMYCISWLIIYWSSPLMPGTLDLPWIIAYFAVVVALSDLAAVQYLRFKARFKESRKKRLPDKQAA